MRGTVHQVPEDLSEARQAGQGFTALPLDAPQAGQEDSSPLGSLPGEEDAAIDLWMPITYATRRYS